MWYFWSTCTFFLDYAILDFLNGSSGVIFDSTYKEYVFIFKDIHPATDDVVFSFQTDTGTKAFFHKYLFTFSEFNR